MVAYKQRTWKERTGEHSAVITEVTAEENQFYKPDDDNSTPETLTITFECTDSDTMETFEFVQKYVNPLTGGKSLFQQLLEAVGEVPDLEGGEFDEQRFVGLKCTVTFGKRKGKEGKEYDCIAGVVARGVVKKEKTIPGIGKRPKKQTKIEDEKDEDGSDLPW